MAPEIRCGLVRSLEGYIKGISPLQTNSNISKRIFVSLKVLSIPDNHGVLVNSCNETFLFAPPEPTLAHRKDVGASDDDGCSGIVVLMFEIYKLCRKY